jgi:hypothetical protein
MAGGLWIAVVRWMLGWEFLERWESLGGIGELGMGVRRTEDAF